MHTFWGAQIWQTPTVGLTTMCNWIPTSKSSKRVAICPTSHGSRDILEAVRCTMTAGSAISHCNIDNIQENWGLSTQLISCSASKVCGFGLQSKPLHFFKILVAYHLQLNHSNICSPLTYQRFPEVCCIFVAMLSNCEPCSAWTRSACSFRSVWSSSRSEASRSMAEAVQLSELPNLES